MNILLYWLSFKTKNFQVLGPKFPQKLFFRNRIKETIVNLEINTTKYLFVPIFISSKALWNFGTKFAKKIILGTEFEKAFVQFRVSIPEYSFVPSFILKKSTFEVLGPNYPKRGLLGRNLKKLFLKLETVAFNNPLYLVSF